MNTLPEKRLSLCANTLWNSIQCLKMRYALWRKLESPIEWLFWLIHSRASKIETEIERRDSQW